MILSNFEIMNYFAKQFEIFLRITILNMYFGYLQYHKCICKCIKRYKIYTITLLYLQTITLSNYAK